MRSIADQVGAWFMVDMAHVAGLVAAGLYPSPLPHAHVVTSTTHKTLCGPRGGIILSDCGDEELYKRLNFAVFPENQGGPLMHVIAAKAVCFQEAMSPAFVDYQKNVIANARAMVSVFRERGFTIVSNGTDDHLFLLSLVGREITGKEADEALGKANITVNKNAVPNDPRPPFVTSGLRIGSPAGTRRGFGEKEFTELANWICDVLEDSTNEALLAATRKKVLALCKQFPVYG
jgi:glycine hydroxymethyltransferase